MSIIGLVIALGMLVDNAIVVMENIGRHVREGKSGREAAIAGSKPSGAVYCGRNHHHRTGLYSYGDDAKRRRAFVRAMPRR